MRIVILVLSLGITLQLTVVIASKQWLVINEYGVKLWPGLRNLGSDFGGNTHLIIEILTYS